MVVIFILLQTLVFTFAKSLCLAETKEEIFLLYDKAKYRIYVRKGEKTLLEFPAGHGLRTFLPKNKKGDFLTPEGLYQIKDIRPSSLYYLFAELTYPNINDISLAYYRGDLDWEKLKEVWSCSTDSLKNTLGYAIGIHGGGDGKREGTKINFNWTQGCIALNNSDLEVLLRFLKPM
ncbi:MAG: L,D-transpeptidase [Caldimicrobium sp.]|nr:L,D-transpeptidase [Caldimicrobium sp.]MCX7873057.1 L,D-transpeptidase [Caldimicrobium sp.]MDW8094810.1 L,D-transpeptidase [Caldimicrobium sp.]